MTNSETSIFDPIVKQIAIEVVRVLKQNPIEFITSTTSEIPKEDDLINGNEACKILSISRPTLWRWEKEGRIPGHGVGGKRYYKRSEIEASLIQKK